MPTLIPMFLHASFLPFPPSVFIIRLLFLVFLGFAAVLYYLSSVTLAMLGPYSMWSLNVN